VLFDVSENDLELLATKIEGPSYEAIRSRMLTGR
jgi:hypothetical protein